jgi:NAD(P)-dependent dehydrogenase (short-subunit alcohol dehydrogenase family)
MSRVFITGSTDGLGVAAARFLIAEGHQVVLHARSPERAEAIVHVVRERLGMVIGDLSSVEQTRSVADQVNAIGRMDAVIHNAGVYLLPGREPTEEGHATTLAVNTLAPYILTAMIQRPDRLVYLSSGMHRSGRTSLDDIDWTQRRWSASQAYSESKLHVATLAAAVARKWPDVLSNSVDPGWVPTKMGGANAPDDLQMGHETQAWLAVSEDPQAKVSGAYWYHRQQNPAAPAVNDPAFQERFLNKLAELTGLPLL